MDITYEKILYIVLAILAQIIVFKLKSKKNSKNIEGRHVVVTGGTSGIGLRIAIECVLKGAHVTVIARNVEMLEKTVNLLEMKRINQDQKVSYKSLDTSRNYNDVCDALSDIEKTVGSIFMLVNCAGLAICGTVEDISVDDAKNLMDVNYFGTYYCTRYVLPKMKEAQEGIIIITASQAALFGIYGYGPYAAAKFALRGLAETIAMECKHKGVSVTLALPCDTDTPGFENEEKTKPKETKIISGSGGLANPENVGKQILEDALNGSFFSILGFESWILTILCCGMAPWGGIGLNLLQAVLMGPLRIIGVILQWHFGRIIKRCAKEKKNSGVQVNLCQCLPLAMRNENDSVHKFEYLEIEKLDSVTSNNSQQEITESSAISESSVNSSISDLRIIKPLDELLETNSKEISTNVESKSLNESNLVHEIIESSQQIAEDETPEVASTTELYKYKNENITAEEISETFKESKLISPLDDTVTDNNSDCLANEFLSMEEDDISNRSLLNHAHDYSNGADDIVNSPPKFNRDCFLRSKNLVDFNQNNLDNDTPKLNFCNLVCSLENQLTPVSVGFSHETNDNKRPILKAKRRIRKP